MKLSVSSVTSWPSANLNAAWSSGTYPRYSALVVDLEDDDAPTTPRLQPLLL